MVDISRDWIKVVVRAKREGEVADHFSTFSLDGKTYFLAEVRRHQLQAFHEGECLDLAMDVKELVSAGKAMVESEEDVTYTTASDSHHVPPAGRVRRQKPEPESSSDSGFGGIRSGSGIRSAEKELARRGYQARKGNQQVQKQWKVSYAPRVKNSEILQFKRKSYPRSFAEKV